MIGAMPNPHLLSSPIFYHGRRNYTELTLPSQISTNVLQVTNVTALPLVTIQMDLMVVSVTAATLGTDKPVKVYVACKISLTSRATRIRKQNTRIVFHFSIGKELGFSRVELLYCESQEKHHNPIRMVVS